MILQNIKNQLKRNQDEDDLGNSPSNIIEGLSNHSLSFFKSKLQNPNPIPTLMNLNNDNNRDHRLENSDSAEDLIKQLTLQALMEKIPNLIQDMKPKEERREADNLFRPVKTIEPPKEKDLPNQPSNLNNLLNGQILDPSQLGSALAENILGVLNNAMLHINGTLTKTMPQVTELMNKDRMQNPFLKKDIASVWNSVQGESKEDNAKLKPQKPEVLIEDENIKAVNKLANEAKKTLDENNLLKQQKATNIPSAFMSPIPNALAQSTENPYFFLSNEPKPINNLSGFMKDLQSDISSGLSDDASNLTASKNQSIRASRNDYGKKDWETNSNISKSEGQITLNFEHTNDYDDAPKFGNRRPNKSEMSDSVDNFSDHTCNFYFEIH